MAQNQPRKLADFDPLTKAEQKVLDELDTGEVIEIGDGKVPPEDAGPERQLRARFLRWLALGGDDDHRLHETGLRVGGALITGDGPAGAETRGLDLEGCEIARDLALVLCRFADPPLLRSARLQGLFLNGSVLPGLGADRLETRGDISLNSVEVTGEVRLLGARIDGALDLTAAELGSVTDDPACWPKKTGDLLLDRCRYGAFTGHGISAAERIRWLALQDPARWGKDFWPQPYEQCAKVFREMGHPADAKEILIEKEKLQRAARRAKLEGPSLWWVGFWDCVFAKTVCYGQRSLTALWWLFGLWLLGTVVFIGVYRAEAFKPNNAFILRSAEWYGCAQNAPSWEYRGSPKNTSQLDCFLEQPEAGGFPEFNAGVYALDVLFPLVEVEQQVHWVPDEDIWPIGGLAKWLVYAEIVMGWLLSLLAVAGLSGIIKSD